MCFGRLRGIRADLTVRRRLPVHPDKQIVEIAL